MKTLVWITHSFRLDSRLTSRLEGKCTFVYYSPYYFAGPREKAILNSCSKDNLNAFYQSLQDFQDQLAAIDADHTLAVYKVSDPIKHINQLIAEHGFDRVVIDLPLFGMWKTTDPMQITVPFEFVDSDLIDDECRNMTAKSRWMSHTRKMKEYKPHRWNSSIQPNPIKESVSLYPDHQIEPLIDPIAVINRALKIAPTYGQTRDKHNGQTRLSTAFQNGTVDPHNIFYQIAEQFQSEGADFTKNEGPHAAMLRQFAFREMTIIQARRSTLTMESDPEEWAKAFLTEKSYINLMEKTNPDSNLEFQNVVDANTGDELVDQILRESYRTGVMPNRARMFFAGWMFYNAPTGFEAFQWLIRTFDCLLLDGQCPTNYVQCTSAMNLQYGKVMLLNRHNVKALLNYNVEEYA